MDSITSFGKQTDKEKFKMKYFFEKCAKIVDFLLTRFWGTFQQQYLLIFYSCLFSSKYFSSRESR